MATAITRSATTAAGERHGLDVAGSNPERHDGHTATARAST
jgi:hypothetical protein